MTPTTATVNAHAVRTSSGKFMTLQEVYAELNIAKSTWNDWKNKGLTPATIKLPNNQVRIRRAVFDKWIEQFEEANA
ncbi:helix-turn-helix transcriptional regulator [Glycomyces sp. MUSA5-2]|uniref:helix-turn-helix transcriptional regulator n=1 Tax=Glycomyces sp. MUSA5-2 TaxID=2053002 RepID=UPI00300B5D8E